jgi:hypothetical protein
MAEDIVRVLRVIEYVGSREWIAYCMQSRNLKGTKRTDKGYMSEAIIGDWPEIIQKGDDDASIEKTTES